MHYQEDSFYIDKVLNGNLPSYAILVEKHKNMAFTIALRIVKNHEDAEEVAQDAFLKAYNALGSFKKEAKFSTWLFKIVYHAALSKLRKKQIQVVHSDDDRTDSGDRDERIDGLDRLHQKERSRIINEAIGRLKEDEATVMTLYYLNENNLNEIETITGLSNSNIKILLHRGRKKLLFELKKILKEEIVDIL